MSKLASSLHYRGAAYIANILRLITLVNELNSCIEANSRELPQVRAFKMPVFNIALNKFAKSSMSRLTSLEKGIVGTEISAISIPKTDFECPAIAPIDYDIFIGDGDRRFNIEKLEEHTKDAISGLPLINQLIIAYDNACMLRTDLTEMMNDISFFMDMSNFKDELSCIDEYIDKSFMELGLEFDVKTPINVIINCTTELINELTKIYDLYYRSAETAHEVGEADKCM